MHINYWFNYQITVILLRYWPIIWCDSLLNSSQMRHLWLFSWYAFHQIVQFFKTNYINKYLFPLVKFLACTQLCITWFCLSCFFVLLFAFLTLPIVHGSWSSWSTWSECDGCSGSSTRSRECSSPPAKFGGLPCLGESQQSRGCHDKITVCSGQHIQRWCI